MKLKQIKMNKEFIPYEQALALKKLGFNKSCFGWYTDKDSALSIGETWRSHRNSIPAPTYSQAFRFFREKYQLDSFQPRKSFPTRFDGRGYNKEVLYSIEIIEKDKCLVNEGYYKTYKEAELECLKKLIEIVKNK